MMIDVDWRQPFIDYIREQKVPSDKNLAEQLIRRAKSYVLVGDKLYRRGTTSGVLMKCVPREEGKDILEEIHKGVCGNHASSCTLVLKDKRRIPLRFVSIRTPHLFTTGFPRFLSIRGARGLQAFNLLPRTSYSNYNYY
jgi:hypothetical protein